MGNKSGKLYAINQEDELVIVDYEDNDIRKGPNKEAVRILYDQVRKDVQRSVTADNHVRFTSKVGKEKSYIALTQTYKVNFSDLK